VSTRPQREGREHHGREAVRRLKLRLAYDGSDFHGWQEQAGDRSVAGELRRCLERILDHPATVVGAGRTDAGVHAVGQVAHADSAGRRAPEALRSGLNSLLPAAVRVLEVQPVEADFHARYGALRKQYSYQLWDGALVPPFLERFVWGVGRKLDLPSMAAAAAPLLGTHDFTSYRAAGCVARSPVRTLDDLSLARHGEMLVVRAVSRGFLRHMVRNLVGALVEVGRGRLEPQALGELLQRRDRRLAPATAPARGLFLVGVDYGDGRGASLEAAPEPVITFSSRPFGV
jgi:tRNA pseudouridine38-40 synthase